MDGPVQFEELAGYRLLTPLLKARFFDRESRGVEIENVDDVWNAFCEKHRMDPATASPIPAEYAGCESVRIREAAAREARIALWKEQAFGPQVGEYFDRRKGMLERVVYSLLRVREAGVARELWFRLREGEATFAELAPAHAGGPEKLTGGIVGPVVLGAMHPVLADRLRGAREGELLEPFAVAGWHLVARMEKRIPAVLDANLRAGILDEIATKRMEEDGR